MNVGSYALVGRISAGPSGAVWKGHDLALDRDVALKQVLSPTPEAAARIRSEAEIQAALDHPHIVRAYDLVESEGDLWLVEEWVDGADLAAVAAESRRLSVAQTLGVLHGALEGLAYAHGHGVVHGDVAPANILVSVDGVSKLADFGLAGRPGAGSGGGTPGFASPEALAGAPLAPTMDVYSAAAVIAGALRGSVQAAPISGSVSLDGLSGDVARILATALAVEPGDRYPEAATFLAAFDGAADRMFGPGWWTTAGVGAAAAATTSGGMAAIGIAGAAGAGVAGAGVGVAADAPIQAGFSAAHVAGRGAKVAAHGGVKAPLIAVGAALTALAVVGVSVAVVRHNPEAGPVAAPAPVSAADADHKVPGSSGAPGGSPSAPTPTPTPKPNPAMGFNGTYTYTSVVTSSVNGEAVGTKSTESWAVSTKCVGTKCTSTVGGWDDSYAMKPTGWTYKSIDKTYCVVAKTGKKTKDRIRRSWQESVKVTKVEDGIVTQLAGTGKLRQIDLCKGQESPRQVVKYKITLKLKKK